VVFVPHEILENEKIINSNILNLFMIKKYFQI
jgi:hypothetical protein